jgi:hypothetical protein
MLPNPAGKASLKLRFSFREMSDFKALRPIFLPAAAREPQPAATASEAARRRGSGAERSMVGTSFGLRQAGHEFWVSHDLAILAAISRKGKLFSHFLFS